MFLKIIATVLEREGQWATPCADWVLANCWGSYLPCCFPWSIPGRSAGIWGFTCEWTSNARRDSKVWEPSACDSNPREIRAEQAPLVENSQLLQTPEISHTSTDGSGSRLGALTPEVPHMGFRSLWWLLLGSIRYWGHNSELGAGISDFHLGSVTLSKSITFLGLKSPQF